MHRCERLEVANLIHLWNSGSPIVADFAGELSVNR